MRLNLRAVKASDIFPAMGVFGGVVVSIKGVFTVGWELTLPKVYHQDENEYDRMIAAITAASRLLPAWSVIHRQDLYLYEEYTPTPGHAKTYLEQCYEKHFEGRRYLTHKAYLFLSFSQRGHIDKPGKASGLFGFEGTCPIPRDEDLDVFRTTALQFINTVTAGDKIKARLIDSEQEWFGHGGKIGILQRYMMLGNESPVMSDIPMGPDFVEAYDNHAIAFTLCEASKMPGSISSVRGVEKMSSAGSQIFTSTGSVLGIQLDCEHAVNHIIVIPPQQSTHQKLETKKRDMTAGYSSSDNRINSEELGEYLDEVQKNGIVTVFSHLNVIAWAKKEEKNDLMSKITTAITRLGAIATYNKHNTPVLYYAGIPSNAFELGIENLMTGPIQTAFALGCYETFDNGFGKGDLLLCDRTRNIPVYTDIDDVSAALSLNANANKFVLGGSGAGKSFSVNRILTCEYNAGALVFGLDVGHSYEVSTRLTAELTGGKDGQYYTWSREEPLTFNPFVGFTEWIDERGLLQPDDTGVNALISVLETVWSPEGDWTTAKEAILKQFICDFVKKMISIKSEDDLPLFDDFYNFIKDDIQPLFNQREIWLTLKKENIIIQRELEAKILRAEENGDSEQLNDLKAQLAKVNENLVETGYKVGTDFIGYDKFDLEDFHITLKAYSKIGEFATFLNDPHPKDIVNSRWTVFELDRLSEIEDKVFYSLCVLQIMHAFDNKMRTIQGRKVLFVDEAWKAIANKTMAPYLRALWKTARKFNTAAMVITQEIADITSSDVIKDTILANSDIKILLDQRNNMNALLDEDGRDDENDIRKLMGLTPKDIALILSMNQANNPKLPYYREIFIKYIAGPSAVYAVEVSPEEVKCYESKFERKAPLLKLAKELGSYKAAIEQLTKK